MGVDSPEAEKAPSSDPGQAIPFGGIIQQGDAGTALLGED